MVHVPRQIVVHVAIDYYASYDVYSGGITVVDLIIIQGTVLGVETYLLMQS